MINQHNNLS